MSNTNSVNTSSIVSKVWAFCQTLRDDGVGYGDYLEQLTYPAAELCVAHLQQAQALKQSILKKAFEGKLLDYKLNS